jgi:hypothetical protein
MKLYTRSKILINLLLKLKLVDKEYEVDIIFKY